MYIVYIDEHTPHLFFLLELFLQSQSIGDVVVERVMICMMMRPPMGEGAMHAFGRMSDEGM